jgi:hypothetical protein
MPKGYFKRIDPTPYRVRLELTGPVTTVYQNEVILADVSTFKDVIGFAFVGWNKPQDPNIVSSDPKNPTLVDGFNNMVVVQATKQVAPHKLFLEKVKKEQEEQKANPTEIKFVEDVPKAPEPISDAEKTPSDKENDKKALIDYLKKFDNKKWFVMKKEDSKSYMERLGVDYSNLPNSKTELIKHLKDYIKSIP